MTETEMQPNDEATSEQGQTEPEPQNEIDPLDDAIAKALDEQGQMDDAHEDGADEQDTPKGDDEETDAPKADEPSGEDVPAHWPEERKQAYSSIKDEAARKLVLEMSKDMEAAHTKRSQEVAETRRQIDSALEPLQPVLQQHGLDSVSGVRELVKHYQDLQPWVQGLKQNPKETIQALAKQYRVDFDGLDADEYIDPDVKALKDEIAQLKGYIGQQTQTQQQAQMQTYQQQIQDFANAQDESGNPKHPHFEAVRPKMSRLLAGGLASSLEDAYEQALYLKPETRQQLTQQQIDAKLAEDRKQREDELEKAKKAKRQLSGSGQAKRASQVNSLDDAINAAYDEVFSAA